ncbi:MAG TPA: single-stranded-DNA-specific exonuclease RecJ [Candidatus Manganitrophaceae bacterium]|nr:single-stranded-DNA-specific exonuclease RecJ [Candidatus Manganitrophaceae bacterium]
MNLLTSEKIHWKLRRSEQEPADSLSSSLAISPVVGRILLNRGIFSPDRTEKFLSPDFECLHDPFLFYDMEKAVDRIAAAVDKKEKVVIYGDYDLDGIAGTALYLELFKELGHPAGYYIPHRLADGYGLHSASIQALRAAGATLMITSDCGTTSYSEISEAARLGLDLIVTDHHQLEAIRPPAAAFLNPFDLQPVPYPFNGLSSAGMAFKVAQAVFKKMGIPAGRLRRLLDLVALGTIADVAPLVDENRYLVKEGLIVIREGMRLGIRALLQTAHLDSASVDPDAVRYHLAPRLNAAGRLYHAGEAVALLTTASWKEALALAGRMDRYNQERQALEAAVREEADRQIATRYASGSPSVIVVASEGWHPGVVGIVAAQVAERHQCPAIAIALSSDGIGKGSGRSARGLHLYRAVLDCSEHLERFGGHAAAIGLTIDRKRIDLFRNALEKAVSEQVCSDEGLLIDAEVDLREIDFNFVKALRILSPFGPSNPEPIFAVHHVRLGSFRRHRRFVQFKIRGEGGLTFDVSGPGYCFSDSALENEGTEIDLAFSPRIDLWQGEERIFLTLKGIRASRGRGPSPASE